MRDGSKKNSKRGAVVKDTRDEAMTKDYLRGMSMSEIGVKYGITQGRVSQVMKEMRERWRENAMINLDARLEIELAKIDHLEQVAWDAYQRSCGERVSTSRKVERVRENDEAKEASGKLKGKKPKDEIVMVNGHEIKLLPVKLYTERKVEQGLGIPAYLDRVAWCINKRLEIFGLDKKRDPAEERGTQVTIINWAGMTAPPADLADDPLERKILEIKNGGTPEGK